MATLFEQYRAQLNKEFDWAQIAQECAEEGCIFLGTVFALTPSGKYYQPFACSNVNECPQCNGTGQTRKLYPCHYCADGWRTSPDQWGGGLFHDLVAGIRVMREHVEDFVDLENMRVRCWVCNHPEMPENTPGFVTHDCNRCGGMGSHEAYQDQEWQRALDHICEKYGLYATSGEGDPCDYIICHQDYDQMEGWTE